MTHPTTPPEMKATLEAAVKALEDLILVADRNGFKVFVDNGRQSITDLRRLLEQPQCKNCKGKGIAADYVGQTMLPVGVECPMCRGTGNALSPSPPAGDYVMVPREPTEAMKRAAFGPIMHGGRQGPISADLLRQEAALGVYRAMIRAAEAEGER